MKKSYRVKKEEEFQAVFFNKQSFANRKFVIYVLDKPNQTHFRVGISVGKRIGNAVVRNSVKRKIRSAIYTMQESIDPTCDFLVIARPSVEKLTFEELQTNLTHVLKLAKILK